MDGGRPRHMWALLDAQVHTPAERLVLLALVTYAQKHGAAWPSHRTLSRVTHLSVSSVQRALRGLEAAGHIVRAIDRQQPGQAVRWTFPTDEAVPLPRAAEPVDFQSAGDLAKRQLRSAIRAGRIPK